MSKKIILLALAAVSAAMLVPPPAALAAWEIDPAGVSFTGTTTQTSFFTSEGEPTYTCEGFDHLTGSYDSGSKTTGSLTIDFTGCHISPFGITIACTTGSSGNTISSGGTFHNVTNGTVTETQITLNSTTWKCDGAPYIWTGTIHAKVTSPACNTLSTVAKMELANAGGFTAGTEGSGTKAPASWSTAATFSFPQAVTKTC